MRAKLAKVQFALAQLVRGRALSKLTSLHRFIHRDRAVQGVAGARADVSGAEDARLAEAIVEEAAAYSSLSSAQVQGERP